MELFRFGDPGEEKPGILLNGKKRDCSDLFVDWNREFFMNEGLKKLSLLVSEVGESLAEIPEESRIASCIARPGMIMCVGLNYSDHAKESGMEVPEEPVLFMKATNTLSGPNDDVSIPKNSTKTDWEVELGVVIGRDALFLESPEAAKEYIAGYCTVHDISEREFQLERSGQWVKGKSCPGFSPTGPVLVTADEVTDPGDLDLKLWVNDQLMQDGNTRTMVFKPDYLVWYISQFMKLEAGDLISTGTPPGVGLGMDPPVYLKKGDKVRLTVEGLGEQEQRFV